MTVVVVVVVVAVERSNDCIERYNFAAVLMLVAVALVELLQIVLGLVQVVLQCWRLQIAAIVAVELLPDIVPVLGLTIEHNPFDTDKD